MGSYHQSPQKRVARSTPEALNEFGFVGYYVDRCVEFGVPAVSASLKGRVGRAAGRLKADGHDDDAIMAGLREIARRNCSPNLLEQIVGDYERVRSGVPIGRVRPPDLRINPVDARDAEMRAEAARRRREKKRDAGGHSGYGG